MKRFIITEAQINQIAKAVSTIPTAQGMPVIDVLRQLIEIPVAAPIDEAKMSESLSE